MPHQKHRRTDPIHLGLGKVLQLLHQVRPVAGHRVTGVVAKLVDGGHLHAALPQVLEQKPVGSSAKAVGV
jgi:hypothetical protein